MQNREIVGQAGKRRVTPTGKIWRIG